MKRTPKKPRNPHFLFFREGWLWLEGWVERKTWLNKEKHPRLFKGARFVAPVLILVPAYFNILVPAYFNFAVPLGAPALPPLPSTSTSSNLAAVGGLACEQFNPDEWDREYGHLDFDGSIWSIASSSSTGLLRFKEKIPLDADVEIVFVPTSETQVNFVITMHDIYELVVGDGSYQGVTLKTAQGNDQSMKVTSTVQGERRVTFENGQMEPGADVKVILNQGVSKLADGTYELNLRLARTTFLEPELAAPVVFATYNFPLPPRFNYQEESAWFSIGLKAASDDSEVRAEVLCVEFE